MHAKVHSPRKLVPWSTPPICKTGAEGFVPVVTAC